MSAPKKKRLRAESVAPIYSFAAAWFIYALLFPLYKISHFVICTALAALVCIVVSSICKKRAAKSTSAGDAAEAKDPVSSYGPEVDSIISDGELAQREMGRLYASIKDTEIRGKINEIMQVSDKIVQDAKHDPSDVPQIRKFLDYYLPTTIKLLNAYDRMDSVGYDGKNISGSKTRIADMLDTTIEAYKKQLDSLFSNQALDIETDIKVMNGMLAQEGLGGTSYLDLQDFLNKQKSNNG